MQIWPLGHNLVFTGVGEDEWIGSLVLAAVPNSMIGLDKPPTWDEILNSNMDDDDQLCVLKFDKRSDVDNLITRLNEVKEVLPE